MDESTIVLFYYINSQMGTFLLKATITLQYFEKKSRFVSVNQHNMYIQTYMYWQTYIHVNNNIIIYLEYVYDVYYR